MLYVETGSSLFLKKKKKEKKNPWQTAFIIAGHFTCAPTPCGEVKMLMDAADPFQAQGPHLYKFEKCEKWIGLHFKPRAHLGTTQGSPFKPASQGDTLHSLPLLFSKRDTTIYLSIFLFKKKPKYILRSLMRLFNTQPTFIICFCP